MTTATRNEGFDADGLGRTYLFRFKKYSKWSSDECPGTVFTRRLRMVARDERPPWRPATSSESKVEPVVGSDPGPDRGGEARAQMKSEGANPPARAPER